MHLHIQSSVKAGHNSIQSIYWTPQPNTNGDTGWLAVNSSSGTAGVTRTSLKSSIPKSYNLHTHQHKGEIAHICWNDVRHFLVTCDEHGNICQWMLNQNSWTVAARYSLVYPHSQSNGTRIVDLQWSHKGNILVVCYRDGVLSILEEQGEERRNYALFNPMPDHVFTCMTFHPNDTSIFLGTAEGQLVVVDMVGNEPAIQQMVQISRNCSVHAIAWNCPRFDTPETHHLWDKGAFTLGIALQNGTLFLLQNYDDRVPVIVYTSLTNIFMQWNTNGDLIAVIGQLTRYRPKNVLLTEYMDPHLYSNILTIYNRRGHTVASICLNKESYLVEFEIAKCLHWAHRDSCLFVAVGTHLYTVKVMKSASKIEVPSLQQIACTKVCSMIKQKRHTEHLVLPPSVQTEIGCMLKSIINHPVPECEYKGQDFLYRPMKKNQIVHCTLKKVNDSLFILYLEFLGNMVPLIGAKQSRTLSTEFILFDARRGPIFSLPQKSEDLTSSPFIQRASRRNSLFRQRTRNMRVHDIKNENSKSEWLHINSSHILGRVTANIWKTKFKIHHRVSTDSLALSGTICYKTSVLHMAPRKINIELSHMLRKINCNENKDFSSLVFCDECSIDKNALVIEMRGKSIKVKFSPKSIPLAFCFDCRDNIVADVQSDFWKYQKNSIESVYNYLHDSSWIIQANEIMRGKLRSKFIEHINMYNMHNKVHFTEKMHLLLSNSKGGSEHKLTFCEDNLNVDTIYNKIQLNKKVKIYSPQKHSYKLLWRHTISRYLKNNYFSQFSYYTTIYDFEKEWENFSHFIDQVVKLRSGPKKQDDALKTEKDTETSFQLHNKAPVWNKTLNIYQLDCGGRVTVESEKNCQFEYNGERVLQFGRIGSNAFTLDFKYPFTPIDAFAVALSSLTHGMK